MRILVLAAALSVAAVASANAGRCLPRDQAVANLQRHYQEQAIGLGIGAGGQAVYEVFVSEKGSWTLLVTRASGISCVLGAGRDWTVLTDDLEGGES